MKGQLRPGRAGVKQFKNKQQSEKFAQKRKLQDGEESGEQILKRDYQWELGFGKHVVCLGFLLSPFRVIIFPDWLNDSKFTSCLIFAVEKLTSKLEAKDVRINS